MPAHTLVVQILLATALMGIPLSDVQCGNEGPNLLRCIASSLDATWVAKNLSPNRRPAVVAAYAWCVRLLGRKFVSKVHLVRLRLWACTAWNAMQQVTKCSAELLPTSGQIQRLVATHIG